MYYQSIIQPVVRTSFNTAGAGLAYQAINPLGLPYSCFKVIIVNDSNIGVTISFDGANPADYVRANSDRIIENITDQNVYNKKGQIYFISAPAAGVGYVYVVGYYR